MWVNDGKVEGSGITHKRISSSPSKIRIEVADFRQVSVVKKNSSEASKPGEGRGDEGERGRGSGGITGSPHSSPVCIQFLAFGGNVASLQLPAQFRGHIDSL